MNMATNNNDALVALQELIDVVAKLRSPDGGCPWDLEQTPQSLTPYVIEEAYEVVDAIKRGDQNHVCEELGDLLLQVILQAQIASESNQFSITEVAQGISKKLIRRHPHVFGEHSVKSIEDVRQTWEQVKAEEKGEVVNNPSLTAKLGRYARTLPPLTAALKMSTKAAEVGFEWDDVDGIWEKFKEELAEFQYALAHETKAQQEGELGDLFFTLIQVARWHDLDPANALDTTNHKFIQRLQKLEAIATKPLSEYTLPELDELWQTAKAQLAASQ